MQSVENEQCGKCRVQYVKCGVWKMQGMENAESGNSECGKSR